MKRKNCYFRDFRRFGLRLLGCIALISLFLPATIAYADGVLRIATTTSTHNSGLTGHLFPLFEQKYGYRIELSTVGTGKALQMGRDGVVDLLIVHARKAEDAFMQAGYGVERRDLMYNDFIIVGPKNDPAGVGKAETAEAAFRKLSAAGFVFISRADDSGTNKKEMMIWEKAGIEPYGDWYYESGRGMVDILKIASDKGYYTLTDRGTWLATENILALKPVFEGDPILNNPYGVITVKPQKDKGVETVGARHFIDWITSKEIKLRISDFKIRGQQLFFPL